MVLTCSKTLMKHYNLTVVEGWEAVNQADLLEY